MSTHYALLWSTVEFSFSFAPVRCRHSALMAVVCLPISLSVPDPKSRMEGLGKLKVGSRPHLEVERSSSYQGTKIFAPHRLCVLQGR